MTWPEIHLLLLLTKTAIWRSSIGFYYVNSIFKTRRGLIPWNLIPRGRLHHRCSWASVWPDISTLSIGLRGTHWSCISFCLVGKQVDNFSSRWCSWPDVDWMLMRHKRTIQALRVDLFCSNSYYPLRSRTSQGIIGLSHCFSGEKSIKHSLCGSAYITVTMALGIGI